MIKWKDLCLTVMIGSGLFAAGYYFHAWRGDRRCEQLVNGVADINSLSDASLAAGFIKLLDKKQYPQLEREFLYLMDAKIMVVQLDTSKGGSGALDRKGINSYVWHKYLEQVRDCAIRKNRQKTVKRTENILRWLERGSPPKQNGVK